MFPSRFFNFRLFADRYFPKEQGSAPVGVGGGYFPGRMFVHRFYPARYYPTATRIVIPPAPFDPAWAMGSNRVAGYLSEPQ